MLSRLYLIDLIDEVVTRNNLIMTINNHICKLCNCWLGDHPTLRDYKKCIACGNTILKELYNMPITNTTIQHIKPEELNPHDYPTTLIIDANLRILLDKINQVRNAYGIPMIVTSGLRSDAQQQQLIADGKSNASKSHHLTGEAVDILDEDRKLTEWVKNNMPLMEQIGFWFEDFDHTPTWVHFQTCAPGSGKRVFIP